MVERSNTSDRINPLYALGHASYSATFASRCCYGGNTVRDYDELQLFATLAAKLHFGRTARACHVSPSALSRTIQRLEADLGVPLFVRDHHRVTLTLAGQALRAHADRVLSDWQAVQRQVQAATGEPAGTLRVYCTVTAAQSLLPDVFAAFRRSYPDIHLELDTGYAADALERVAGEDVDAAVAALPTRLPTALITQEIATTPVVFAAPTSAGPVRSAVERRKIDWSALPLVLPARGLARTYADRWLRAHRVTPNIYAEIQGHEAILSLVALGCGIGVVPQLVLDKSAVRDAVQQLDVRPPMEQFRIGVCVRRRSLTDPLINALWESISRWQATERTVLRNSG
jgi:LysR family positive regulator for ilvC